MPCERGFDSGYGFVSDRTGYITHSNNCYHDLYRCSTEQDELWFDNLFNKSCEYTMDLFREQARQIISNHNTSRPLFLELSLQSVNGDYWAPERLLAEFCGSSFNKSRCVMQAMLGAAEEVLEAVITELKVIGMWTETLLIFVSDNGAPNNDYGSNGNLRGHKHTIYEGGVRVPSFVYSENEALLSHRGSTDCCFYVADWVSTIIGLVTRTTQLFTNILDGIDQSNLFTNNSCARKTVLLDVDPKLGVGGYIEGEYKLIIGEQNDEVRACNSSFLNTSDLEWGKVELFNLIDDPGETIEISDSHINLVSYMMNEMEKLLTGTIPCLKEYEVIFAARANQRPEFRNPAL
eukprot:sb/3466261/